MPASNAKTSSATSALEREVIITRVFDAPRELVFKCWTEPEHLQHWQGAPRGFTVTTQESDIRPGGFFRICMRSAEGVDRWLRGDYQEIAKPEWIVFTHVWQDAEGKAGQETLVTVTFIERNGKTELTLRQTGFSSVESHDGHKYGWTSALDVLGEYLAEASARRAATSAPEREVIITRVFDAPRELVFKAWTEPAHLAQWWGPRGFTNPVCEVDLRIGGAWRIVMRAPDGIEYPGRGVYREIVRPERLVFTNIALDKDGNPIIDGLTTVTFADHGAKTQLTLQTRAVGLVSYAARMLEGMEAGWSQSLERLAEKLARPTSTSDREIVATRVFDAPRELVFQMWTDPQHISNWYGPRGFTTTTHEMDVRPGGVWRHVMHGPDGTDYPNEIVYLEVVKPERLVYDHVSEPPFQTTVTFAERDGKTEVTARMLFESATLRNKVATEHHAVEGLHQTLERLAEQLLQMPPADQEFVFTRVFDAPRDLVWKAFTESERLIQWWGPKGYTMLACTVDLRPGGVFHYSMQSPDGRVMWGKWVYREIVPPERLVTVVSFTDAEGNLLRHPMSPTWPLELLHTMTLSERHGKTTLTVTGVPTNATEEERKTFNAGRNSMEAGFTGTLNQLAAYLASCRGAD
jgi:uncharacterized protein YndB with AHSA1/START domain